MPSFFFDETYCLFKPDKHKNVNLILILLVKKRKEKDKFVNKNWQIDETKIESETLLEDAYLVSTTSRSKVLLIVSYDSWVTFRKFILFRKWYHMVTVGRFGLRNGKNAVLKQNGKNDYRADYWNIHSTIRSTTQNDIFRPSTFIWNVKSQANEEKWTRDYIETNSHTKMKKQRKKFVKLIKFYGFRTFLFIFSFHF